MSKAASGNCRTESKNKLTTKDIVFVGMFTAVLAVLSQVSIPMPSSVPITLQTFAVALTGAILGWKLGTASTVVYVLLGGVGVPVFAGFGGGLSALVGFSGGFIWGFIFMALLCGVGACMKHKALGIVVGIAGLAICHLLGVLQYSIVASTSFGASFLLVSVPYLLKDVLSVVIAFILGSIVRGQLVKAGMLTR